MTNAGAKRIVDHRLGDAAVFCGGTAIIAVIAVRSIASDDHWGIRSLNLAAFTVTFGILVSLFTMVSSLHAYRGLGTYPWLGLVAVASAFAFSWLWYPVLALSIIGTFCTLKYLLAVRRAGEKTWNPIRPVPPLASISLGMILAGFAVALAGEGWLWDSLGFESQRWFGVYVLFFCLAAWWRLAHAAIEWPFAVTFNAMYRMRGIGPGRDESPPVGPVIVIANHAGYFDPAILEVVLPRPVTGLMSSLYYDLWFVKPVAKYIFRIIRVPHATIRHEAPELRDAVAALDRGECVLMFPEAWLRRKEDVPLKRFAQGVWQILKERPETPVISCWIEGTWGSHFSFKDGPPMKGKRFDIRRPIQIGVSAPAIVPPDVLLEHWDTRFYLMNEVSQARKHLGLEPLPRFERNLTDSDS